MIPVEEREVDNNPPVARQRSLPKNDNLREVAMHLAGNLEPSAGRSGHMTGRLERLPEIVEWSAKRRELLEGLVKMAASIG